MATNVTNQDYFKNGFETWQKYAQAYTDFVIESTQQALGQSLSFRERLDKVVGEAAKKAQALGAQEQELALGMAEAFQAQAQAASERLSKFWTTPAAK